MCMGGGGNSGPNYTNVTDAAGNSYRVEQGVPGDYAARGATTVAQYQTMASQDLSDRQIASQKDIADQQDAFNRQQLAAQQAQEDLAKKQAQEQADRQSAYDTGRSKNLAEGTQAINDAFAQFGDEYFNKYAHDYMSQVGDQVNYQKDLATRGTTFDMARAGLIDSQAHANQLGLIEETAGRTLADKTAEAQGAANALRTNVGNEKTSLLGQLTNTSSLGSPIAGNTMDDVNAAIQTQKSAISGIGANANDIVAGTQGVPQVSTLGNIFSGILQGAGSYTSGATANYMMGKGLTGTPSSGVKP
jgi:hypothetical protein